jgi:hypothetical protein
MDVVTNATYWYRARAFNAFGFSDYSSPVSIGIFPPPTPSNFYVNGFIGEADLRWSYDLSLPTEVKIERAPDIEGAPGVWTEIANAIPNRGQYNDISLPLKSTWWYRIRIHNWIGDSDYTDPVSVTLLFPFHL